MSQGDSNEGRWNEFKILPAVLFYCQSKPKLPDQFCFVSPTAILTLNGLRLHKALDDPPLQRYGGNRTDSSLRKGPYLLLSSKQQWSSRCVHKSLIETSEQH